MNKNPHNNATGASTFHENITCIIHSDKFPDFIATVNYLKITRYMLAQSWGNTVPIN